MSTAAYSIQRTNHFAPRTQGASVSRMAWNVLLLLLIVSFGVGYMVVVNKTVVRGYEIRSAEKKLESLRSLSQQNQIKLSQREAVARLTSEAQALGLVPVGRVEYVTRTKPGVARR